MVKEVKKKTNTKKPKSILTCLIRYVLLQFLKYKTLYILPFLLFPQLCIFFTFLYLVLPTALLLSKEELSIPSEYSIFKIQEREGKGKGSRGERCQKAEGWCFPDAELQSILMVILQDCNLGLLDL